MATRNTTWYRFGRTGGVANVDMDAIDGNDATLHDKDLCIVLDVDTLIAEEFVMDIDNAGAADGVLIVTPTTNPGDKRWLFTRRRSRTIIETLTGTKTMGLGDMDGYNVYDPGGSTRIVLLPAEEKGFVVIQNSADAAESLTVKDDSNTDTIGTLPQNGSGLFICDGTTWRQFANTGAMVATTGTFSGDIVTTEDVKIGDGKFIGSTSDPDAIAISAGGDITLTQDLIFAVGKLIGVLGDLDLITLTADTVTVAGAVAATSVSVGGNVIATTAGAEFAVQNPTNTAVFHVGGSTTVNLADNETITFEVGGNIFTVVNGTTGAGAVFFADYASATIVKLADPSAEFEITDTDTAKIAVFKGAADGTVSIKNYQNAVRALRVNSLGKVNAATAPA